MIEKVTPTLIAQKSEPLVSVVLPVYNGEKYLAEAIDSILAQTFVNFELIMIDDGSTDNSSQILREYERRDARVRAIVRENRGLATTLNDAIDIARGEWIARMDQDDIALPQRFERQLEWLKKSGADISGSWVQRFGTSDRRIVRLCETDDAIKMEMLFSSPFAHPSVMMRTALVKQLRYDPEWDKAEDYDLWERAVRAGWKLANVPEVLLLYRVHGSQISTATSARQRELTLKIQRRYWESVFETQHMSRRGMDEVLRVCGDETFGANMDDVDAALAGLLQHSHGEGRDAILRHVTRIYLRVAADCPNVVQRWKKFFPNSGWWETMPTKFKLWMLREFRIRPSDGGIFNLLRKLYIIVIRP